LPGGKIPITLPTDRETIEAGLAGIDAEQARLVLIRNTLDLEVLWVSEALLAEVAALPSLEQAGPLRPITFDEQGNLLLPELEGA
jgi:hypothetical protein